MSGSEPGGFFAAAYRTHRFCNPLSEPLLNAALDAAELRPGMRAADLGCGNAEMALHLAERHGLTVDAVEVSPGMQALARERMAGRGAPGRVTLHPGDAENFLRGAESYDLILAIGAHALFRAAPDVAGVFLRLHPHVVPGGRMLFGDPFWRRHPGERLSALLPGFLTHAEYIRAGEAAGLLPLFAGESPQLDWDDYAWRMERSVRAYVSERPELPNGAALLARATLQRKVYLEEARDALAFGLYVFAAPEG